MVTLAATPAKSPMIRRDRVESAPERAEEVTSCALVEVVLFESRTVSVTV